MAKRLTEQQEAAIVWLTQPKAVWQSYEYVAEQIGVSRQALYNWRNNDDFNDELKRRIVRSTLDRMPDIMASIPDHIITEGNAALFRTLLQAHGMLTDRVEVETKGDGMDSAAMRERIEALRKGQRKEDDV